MADFLKKIIPLGASARKKVVVQDIVSKKSSKATPIESGDRSFKRIIPAPKPGKEKLPSKTHVPAKEKIESEPDITVSTWEPSPEKSSFLAFRLSYKLVGGAVLVILFLFALIITTVFAKTTIILRPVAAKIIIPSLAIVADSKINSVDLGQRRIPALKIGVEKSYQETFTSSGKKHIEELSKGSVTIFNAFDSRPQVLVVGTRFTESGGKIFKLTKTITVPGAKVEEGKIIPSSLVAPVIAEKPGAEYNIASASFSIPGFKGTPKYEAFYAKSSESMRGGFVGDAKVVTSADVKSAQEKVSSELFEQLKAELDKKLPSVNEFIILDGSRNIRINKINSPRPDERKDEFTADGRGIAEIIIFKKLDLIHLLGVTFLSPERPSTLVESLQEVKFENPRLNTLSGELAFLVSGGAMAVRVIDKGEVQKAVASKRISKLEAYLRGRPEIAGFTIKNFPAWSWKTPGRIEAIEIKIDLPAN